MSSRWAGNHLAAIIIPVQSGTYRHLPGRVTGLLAESGLIKRHSPLDTQAVSVLSRLEAWPRSVTDPGTSNGWRSTVGSWVSSRCGAFPSVDGSCADGHAVEEAGGELDVCAAASGEAELPQFCGGTVVVVDYLIRGIGVDLAGAVAVDLCPYVVEKSGQLRFVVGARARRAARLWWP